MKYLHSEVRRELPNHLFQSQVSRCKHNFIQFYVVLLIRLLVCFYKVLVPTTQLQTTAIGFLHFQKNYTVG